MTQRKLIIYKNYVGTYRVHFLNDMSDAFDTHVWLKKDNTRDQAFDQKILFDHLTFHPQILPKGFFLRQLIAVLSHLRKIKPDLVITTEYNLITIWVLVLRFVTGWKYKVVSMCDDSYNMIAGNDFTITHRIARRCVSPFLDDIITIEPRVRDWYQKNYHKGYFFPIIRNDNLTRNDYAKSLSLAQETIDRYNLANKQIVLFVGRLVKLKNLDTLLKAIAKLNQDNIQLVIVGNGTEERHLKQLAEELGVNVIMTGNLFGDALNVWFNIAKVLVLPSYQEAFGAVTNEALIAGCYAVVSQSAGSQCIIEDGINGYVFETMNVDDLVKKLNMALALPTTSIGNDDGLRKNLMVYDYSTMIKQLIDHLYQL